MGRNRLVVVARAGAALLTLSALLLGLPAVLAVLAGWPLPTRLPTLGQLVDGLGSPSISDTMLVKGIAIVCWCAWTQLIACAVAEIHAWVRGRTAGRLPLAGALQPFVRQLVLSVVVLAGPLRAAAPMAVPLQAVSAVQFTPAPAAESANVGLPADHEVSGPASPAPAPAPTCTVRPRDSLWSLAAAHLGDGYRWRELFELNRGVSQSDGRSLQEPNLIRPGWILTFPADASGLAPPPLPPQPEPEPDPTPAAQEVTPAFPDAPESVPVPVPSERAAPAPTPAPAADGETPTEVTEDDASDVPVSAVAGVGLMAAGVVVTLDRLRRVQQRRRRTGRMIAVPSGLAADAELSLRSIAAGSPVDRLDAALRAFSSQIAAARPDLIPSLEAVSVGPDSVEILLSRPADVPGGPFEVTAGGQAWTLPADAEVSEAAAGRAAPAPALVTVGTIAGKAVLIDLEAHPRTALIGPPAEARSCFSALLWELCTSRWADAVHVVLIGEPPAGVAGLDRLKVFATVAEAFADLEAETLALSTELGAGGHQSPFSARLAEHADGWVPTVVLAADPADAGLDRLLRLASEHHGLAVVVLGQPDAEVDRTIAMSDGLVDVQPPGLHLKSDRLTESETETIGALIDLASSDDEGPEIVLDLHDPPRPAVGDDFTQPVLFPTPERARAEVEVTILGPPDVVGGKMPIDRKKSKELVVYLALHPRGADEGRIKTALWPDQIPTQGAFNQTMSRARMCLGRAGDDSHHLPHVADGIYRLGAGVDSDFHRLEQAFAAATTNGTENTMADLASALSAVRGMPFEGAEGYEWVHLDGLLARIEAVTADAALLLAEWHLDRRDASRTLWASSQGLLASPGDERLFRMKMRAHDLSGNPAGVESTMKELCRVVEALEPFDDLHPETVSLYDELSRRRRRTG